MDNIRKTAWEIADDQEEEAKKSFMDDLVRPSQYKAPHSINFEETLDEYDDSQDLEKEKDHPYPIQAMPQIIVTAPAPSGNSLMVPGMNAQGGSGAKQDVRGTVALGPDQEFAVKGGVRLSMI